MLHFKDRRLVKFGLHVKALRQRLGLSINDVAANSSISRRDLQAIEEGSKNFGFTTLLELSKGLGVRPIELPDIDFED